MAVTSKVAGLSDYAKYETDKVIVFSVSIMRQALFFIGRKRCVKLYYTNCYSNCNKKLKYRPIN